MLELFHICASYGTQRVLQDVTLSFQRGEVLTLIGPNGSGKSTLLKTACHLLRPTAGAVLVDGVPAASLKPKNLARRVAYLPQHRAVPDMTAARMVLHGRFPHLSYPRRFRPADWEIVRSALAEMDALELSERSMKELSGGQRQKVYLAMALAQQADTILMDEPTTYLDIAHQLHVTALAHTLGAQGKAVVMVLHDLPLALRTADRAALLCQGRLVRMGTPEELYERGDIPRAFGVSLRQVRAGQDWHYVCERQEVSTWHSSRFL